MSYEIYSLVWKNKNLHLFEFYSAGLIAFFDTLSWSWVTTTSSVPLKVIIPTLALVKIRLLILQTTKFLLCSLAELVLVFSIQSFFDTWQIGSQAVQKFVIDRQEYYQKHGQPKYISANPSARESPVLWPTQKPYQHTFSYKGFAST